MSFGLSVSVLYSRFRCSAPPALVPFPLELLLSVLLQPPSPFSSSFLLCLLLLTSATPVSTLATCAGPPGCSAVSSELSVSALFSRLRRTALLSRGLFSVLLPLSLLLSLSLLPLLLLLLLLMSLLLLRLKILSLSLSLEGVGDRERASPMPLPLLPPLPLSLSLPDPSPPPPPLLPPLSTPLPPSTPLPVLPTARLTTSQPLRLSVPSLVCGCFWVRHSWYLASCASTMSCQYRSRIDAGSNITFLWVRSS